MERVAAMLEARREQLAERSLVEMRAEIPSYAAIEDRTVLADIVKHTAANHDALRAMLLQGRPVAAEDLAFIRPHAAMRVRRGIPLPDFLHAFRIGHRVIWDAIVQLAEEEPEIRTTALAAARTVLEFIDHASTQAAETYLEVQQLLLAEGDRVRRDLLEDLLAGREPAPGPRLNAARAAGLAPDCRCLLIAAVPVRPPDDEFALRAAASALARAAGGAVRPLVVVRQDEIVITRALETIDPQPLVGRLGAARSRLAADGVGLAIGVSTAFESTAGLPDAYREACSAIESLGPDGGVLALAELSAFEYLTLRGDATAARLITPAVRRFVEEDIAAGGTLTSTLLAYAASNLNAKVAAQRLFVHVNTAHHRLARIEERTGCDLRDLAHVQELLIAIRLASRSGSGSAASPQSQRL
jgi:hypothetical protein